MPDDTELLTIKNVAQKLLVPIDTIYGWRHKGQGPPAIKIGRHLRFPKAALIEWLNSQPGAEHLRNDRVEAAASDSQARSGEKCQTKRSAPRRARSRS